jgi:predicted secreted hydrolase
MKWITLTFLTVYITSCSTFVTTNDTKDYFATLPKDEGIHPKNSLEWWYITGFLEDDNGKEYGIEYVFFHFRTKDRRQRLMMNVAITTPSDSTFYYDYQIELLRDYAKEGLPLNFKLENHQWIGELGNYNIISSFNNGLRGFNLSTIKTEPVILHQGKGYVTYGDIASAGYYSIPRLETTGKLFLDGDSIPVTGELWYDRQWNCGAVTEKNVSWDWTAISFDNNTELMLYRVTRGKNKSIVYGGTFVKENNEIVDLAHEDIRIETSHIWKSPKTKKEYPMQWDINIEKIGFEGTLISRLHSQELELKNWAQSKIYWEGMCTVNGTINNLPVKGKAYLEMTD